MGAYGLGRAGPVVSSAILVARFDAGLIVSAYLSSFRRLQAVNALALAVVAGALAAGA